MQITGLKRDHLLKMELKASLSMYVGTMGHGNQKQDIPILNMKCSHPTVQDISDRCLKYIYNF